MKQTTVRKTISRVKIEQYVKILLVGCSCMLMGLMILNFLVLLSLLIGMVNLKLSGQNTNSYYITENQATFAGSYQAVLELVNGQSLPEIRLSTVLMVIALVAIVGYIGQMIIEKIDIFSRTRNYTKFIKLGSVTYLAVGVCAVMTTIWLAPALLVPNLILFILSLAMAFFALLYIYFSIKITLINFRKI